MLGIHKKEKMQFQRQDTTLPIVDIDNRNGQEIRDRHSSLFPNTIRSIICATSNGGKTNLILNLLYSPVGLRFENIYIFSRTLHQPKYQQLFKILSPLKQIGIYKYDNSVEIPPPKDIKKNSIVIFDDVACDKQDRIRAYFSMGRHNNLDVFYLTQSYCRIPKHLIRDCANLIVAFRQDVLNLRRIYDDHVNMDMTYEKFKRICSTCWENGKFGFLVIDKECTIQGGRYRMGFDTFIIPPP